MAYLVIEEMCNGCARCVPFCPIEAIVIEDDKAVIDANKCTDCGACAPECEEEAIIPG